MVVSLRNTRELPGTAKHPQGRLFAPVGDYRGDPWKLAPENWIGGGDTPAHSDITAWHSTEHASLPRYDQPQGVDPDHYDGPDWDNANDEDNPDYHDYSVDSKDRPIAEHGSAIGMHFGSLRAAIDRAKSGSIEERSYVHPVRIPQRTLVDPPQGSFRTPRPGGSFAGGWYRANKPGPDGEWSTWSDTAANHAERGTDMVEAGKTIPYENEAEDKGSISYRTLPETTRTWAEDVLNARAPGSGRPAGAGTPDVDWNDEHAVRNVPHPALVHLAERGYNPVVRGDLGEVRENIGERARRASEGSRHPMGTSDSSRPVRYKDDGPMPGPLKQPEPTAESRRAAFLQAQDWTMGKPGEKPTPLFDYGELDPSRSRRE